jgi:RNA polymerase sigma factor (sigma-70 family)
MRSAFAVSRRGLAPPQAASFEPTGVPNGQVRRFRTTRWSLVLRAGGAEGRQAASELCRAYWHPVCGFFRSQGAREGEANDLTQGFFAALHRRRDFGKLDPSQGKFRSWLCTCAGRHLLNWRARERAAKRGGKYKHESWDAQSENVQATPESQELLDPERLFNRHWALTVISRALARLRAHYAERDQGEIFQSFEGDYSGEGADVSDSELAALLGKTETAVRQERFRMKPDMRKRFARFLRAEIAETVAARADIDQEIRDLLRALA